jgi:hypothetical protein
MKHINSKPHRNFSINPYIKKKAELARKEHCALRKKLRRQFYNGMYKNSKCAERAVF